MMKRENFKKMAHITSMLLCCTILFYSINTPAFAYGQDSAAVNNHELCAHHTAHTLGFSGEANGKCDFTCSICPVQERINALPEAEQLKAMEESAQAQLPARIAAIYADISALPETDAAQLNTDRLETLAAVLGKNRSSNFARTIMRGSAELLNINANIKKIDDQNYNILIPGITEGTPLPLKTFTSFLGGYRFTAKAENTAGDESDISIVLNSGANLAFDIPTVDGNIPAGTYPITLDFSKITSVKDVGFADGSTVVTINLVVGKEAANEAPFEPYRIQTVSPSNVDIMLFDYWISSPTAHDHIEHGTRHQRTRLTCGIPECEGIKSEASAIDPGGSFYNNGINKHHAFAFNTGANTKNDALWNKWTGDHGAQWPGIVQPMLQDGYPVLNLDQSEVNNVSIFKDEGRPAKESLEYLFSPVDGEGKKAYPHANGLLKIDPDTGNYKYNSLENFASYDQQTQQFQVYESWAVTGTNKEQGQFFPFNKASEVFQIENGVFTPTDAHAGESAFLNHYFGLTLDVDFQQPAKGKVSNAANAQDMTFSFSGDDDVWIFIDDVLVADLGGIHNAMSVTINFADGEIKIDRKKNFDQPTSSTRTITSIKEQFETAGVNVESGFKGKTFADHTVHELKMFYLERGNSASNLEFSFNLMEERFDNIFKVDQKGDSLSGVTFELYEADAAFAAVGSAIASLTTDKNGAVNLVKDVDGTPMPIVFKPNQNYVLKETKTPDGYVTTGDIHLKYDEDIGMLEVQNQWETGAVAGFESRITQSGQLQFKGGGDASKAGQKGLILAVPLFNPEHKGGAATKGWRPLYGSVTEGFHMVEVDESENEEAYQKAALEAALRQLENPKNEHWYIQYNQDLMRFEGLLVGLPGSAGRYVFVNPTDGDMITAYYLLNPDDGTFDGCTTTEEKYNKLAKKIKDMTEAERADYFYAQQKNMKLLDISQFDRHFYTRLYIPNQVRQLRVHKQDESGKSLPGAEFTLYSDEACEYAVARGITDQDGNMSFSAQNNGGNGLGEGTPLSSNVQFALSRDDAAGSREARSYWLKETAAPAGFTLNESVTEIRVTDDSIYANAGTPDNGVSVRKGAGQLIQTMVRYAADDKLNVTLRDILATKYTYKNVPGKDLPDFDTWEKAVDEAPLSLHYGLKGALLDYGLHDTGLKPYFTTNEGWLGFGVKQNYDAHKNDDTEWALAGGIKDDIQNIDISALLTGTTTVVVTDKERPPESETGKLTVSKTVIGTAASESERFTFTILLTDNSNTPVSDSYSYTGSSIEGATAPATGILNFGADGKANIALSHGQSITISGLPVGAKYSVEEKACPGYTVKTLDGATGTIQKDTESKVSFVNHKINGGDDSTVDVTVKKVWNLDNGGTPAESVTMTLFKNGEPYQTVVLNSQNSWTHTWPNLNSSDYWYVQEMDVPDGFTASTTQNGSIFTVTNDDINPADPINSADPGAPQTGDDSHLILWFILMAVSGLGLIATLVYFKRNKSNPKHLK